MKVIDYNDLYGTEREVDCPKGAFKSIRILLEADGMGYTVTRTSIPKSSTPHFWHYKNHLETCVCIQGWGILTNVETEEKHTIAVGDTYALDKHDAHTFQAFEDVVLICVFNPPLKGREVHREDGSYDG